MNIVLFTRIMSQNNRHNVPTQQLMLRASFVLTTNSQLRQHTKVKSLLRQSGHNQMTRVQHRTIIRLMRRPTLVNRFLILKASVTTTHRFITRVTISPVLATARRRRPVIMLTLRLYVGAFRLLLGRDILRHS